MLFRSDRDVNFDQTVGVIYSIGVEGSKDLSQRLDEQKSYEKNQLRSASKQLFYSRMKTLKSRLTNSQAAKSRRLNKAFDAREMANQTIFNLSSKTTELNLQRNIDSPIRKSLDKMQIKWDYKPQMTVEMIYKDLLNGKYRHIVIVSHASETGALFDVEQNEVEPELFFQLGQHVQTLAVFSCYSNKVRDRYKFSPKSTGLYNQRFFIHLPVSDDIGNFTVNRGDHSVLSKFLLHVDDFLLQNTSQSNLKPTTKKLYQIRFSEFMSQGMAYSVKLNRKFLGILSDSNEEIYLDPSDLKIGKNILVLGNLNIDRKSTRLNSSHSQQSRMPSSA